MKNEDAEKWRQAIRRRMEVIGRGRGQVLEYLPSTLDECRFKDFMQGKTDNFSFQDKRDLVFVLGRNWESRHKPQSSVVNREVLYHLTDEELLEQLNPEPEDAE